MQKTKCLAVMLLSTEYLSFLSWSNENVSKSVSRFGFVGCKFRKFSTIICNYSTVNIQITLFLYFNSIILFLNQFFCIVSRFVHDYRVSAYFIRAKYTLVK